MSLFKKKIGLALGSGAARGLAHIGVIKVLEENNIAINCISGSSIGAVVGGLYAYTKDIKLIEDLAYSKDYKELVQAFFDPSLKSSLFNGDRVLDLLGGYIPDDALIQDTQIPFISVATDLLTAKTYMFKEGNLKQAIRASMSIPLLLKPVEYEGMLLVDGGTTDPVPIDAVKELGAQRVIAANLYTKMFPKKLDYAKLNMADVFKTYLEIYLFNQADKSMNEADIQLNLPVREDLPLTAFAEDPTEIIKIGEEETKKVIHKLKLL